MPKKQTAGKSASAKNRRVRVRTYRHGLGDCHLVSFTKPDGSLFHILIDCGVVDLTPNPATLMSNLAKQIAREVRQPGKPKPVLDVVVVTHQHTDHISGFQQAKEEFERMEMKRLWMGWTEESGNREAARIKKELLKELAAVRRACAQLTSIRKDAGAKIQGVLDFFEMAGAAGDETQAILDDLQAREGIDISYHEPGTTFLLPEVPNVRVYVLGPPKDIEKFKIRNPRKSKHEGYEDAGIAAAAAGFVDALLPSSDQGEMSYPFDRSYRKSESDAAAEPFFIQHYGFGPDNAAQWRTIDTAWLECAEQVALALNNFTNNTSLVLAFELVDTGEVLLFPGDAQIGSWLAWQELTWTVPAAGGGTRKVDVKELFARTVFYKASHHASHNGTPSEPGLEQMTNRNLVTIVPVDMAMSKRKHWDRTLPWQPLLSRLKERTRGRLVLTDVNEPAVTATHLTDLTAAERKRFAQQVTISPEWVDYTL